jgi:myo-inositol-1(or 4)-monophosphatase
VSGAGRPAARELLALARELARAAADVHARGLAADLTVHTKSSPTDLVSQVDREAEALIVDRLRATRPGDAVLAEEGTELTSSTGVRWIVDPLDGTTNYVYGYPAFAVSIAVEVDGVAEAGVVHDSSAGHVYEAVRGGGALCDGAPIHVRDQGELAHALVATGFAYRAEQREHQGRAAAYVLARVRDIRRGGSAALDLCHLAAGHVDAYWEVGTALWDFAAGTLIAQEAGAEVRLPEPAHGAGPAVVAARPALMPALLDLLRAAGAIT